jgi:hypothetical protein
MYYYQENCFFRSGHSFSLIKRWVRSGWLKRPRKAKNGRETFFIGIFVGKPPREIFDEKEDVSYCFV